MITIKSSLKHGITKQLRTLYFFCVDLKQNSPNTTLFTLLILISFSSQSFTQTSTPICSDFEDSTTQAWYTVLANATLGTPALDGSTYLQVTDDWGYSWAANAFNYPQDWSKSECLCFDYKILDDGASNTLSLNPQVTIFQGNANPDLAPLKATFVVSATVTENSPWIQICVPLTPGTNPPVSGSGTWTLTGSGTWNSLLSNVTGVAFYIDLTPNGSIETIGLDNICLKNGCTPITDGDYCCQDTNRVFNGTFESGNTGFSSSYAVGIAPGTYSIGNSAAAYGATINDHSFCSGNFPNNNNYMLANGRTQQTGSSTIWEQSIGGLIAGQRYKICANFKNMPQCNFDVLPKVTLRIGNNSNVATISTNAADPCDWQNIEFNFTASSSSMLAQIILDESGIGDGNDVAIDDIGVFKLKDPDLNITVSHQGSNQQIYASVNGFSSIDDTIPGGCDYWWFVAETSSASPLNINWNTFAWGNQNFSNTSAGSPWLLTTTFPGYNFNKNKLYVIGLTTNECGCYASEQVYQVTYHSLRNSVNREDLKLTKEQEEALRAYLKKSIDQPQTVGIHHPQPQNSELQLYPNPSDGMLTANLEDDFITTIEIRSSVGSLVKTIALNGSSHKETIQIEALPAGLYLVSAIGASKQVYTSSFVKN